MLKSMPWPKLLTVAPGVTNCRESIEVTPMPVRSLPVRTVAETGVCWASVRRRSAVTTTSSSTTRWDVSVELVCGVVELTDWAADVPYQPSAKSDAPNR
jgi:hypothetical protein